MAKILLINPAGWQKESINLGLSYIAGFIGELGHNVLILDLNANQISDDYLISRVGDFTPSVIGVSVKTATANEAGRIISLLSKKIPDIIYVAGGPHITLCAESFMQAYPDCTYTVSGEGEITFGRLVEAIVTGATPVDIGGVAWRNNNDIVLTHWEPPSGLDALPLPNLDVIEGFSWAGFRYPIVTSRGCPFDCIYCCVNKLTGSRKWRSRSALNVVDELEHVVKTHNITHFEIWDDNFTLDLNRAKEICHEIIKRGIHLSWYCHNGIRADRIDHELAGLMKAAGCTSVAFGIESGNSETFDSIKKGEPLSAVVDAVKIVKDAGIEAVGYFIIGLPGDTLERFVETVRFQRSLSLNHYVFGVLIPYPKTEVWDIVCQRGRLFCDITETQHFSNDIVPVSFELPEFPKKDMVRAYYIAKYFELFEVADRLAASGVEVNIVYESTQSIISHIPGMIIACPLGSNHIIVGAGEEELRALSAFDQVPNSINLKFESSLNLGVSKGCILVMPVVSLTKIPANEYTAIVGVDPQKYLQHTSIYKGIPENKGWLTIGIFRARQVLTAKVRQIELVRRLYHYLDHKMLSRVRRKCVFIQKKTSLLRLKAVNCSGIGVLVDLVSKPLRVDSTVLGLSSYEENSISCWRWGDGKEQVVMFKSEAGLRLKFLLKFASPFANQQIYVKINNKIVDTISHQQDNVLLERVYSFTSDLENTISIVFKTSSKDICAFDHDSRDLTAVFYEIKVVDANTYENCDFNLLSKNTIKQLQHKFVDTLKYIRRNHSAKLYFGVDAINFFKTKNSLMHIKPENKRINYDDYSSYL